jgi:hypothetical protein
MGRYARRSSAGQSLIFLLRCGPNVLVIGEAGEINGKLVDYSQNPKR